MKWIRLSACLASATPLAGALEPGFWINELHYDNSGTDTGEFVEVVGPATFTDLAAVRLTLYNGGNGEPYGSSHLLSSFTPGTTVDGFTLYSKAIGGQQNGAPDGLSLDLNGEVLHFISYEGLFTASAGPAAGLTSTDVGVFEADTAPPEGAIGLGGSGAVAGDFAWSTFSEATPGGLNVGQLIVPEPRTGLLLVLGAVGLCLGRWRRPRQ